MSLNISLKYAADAIGDVAGAAADAVTGALGSLFGGDDEKKAEEP